jgi:outer membrane protein assembly factor BamB
MAAAANIRRALRWLAAALGALLAAGATTAAVAQTVATYHGHADRSGNFVMPALTWANAGALRLAPGFAPRFPGHLYAQPLYWRPPGSTSGMLVVASESDVVSAIDAASGRILWSRSLGTPEPLTEFACGNIDPLGVTGTPVIDPASGTLFVDAMVRGAAGPSHQIFALSLADGSIRSGWPVDVAAALRRLGLEFDPRVQNQRAALALLGGNVYVGYGGFFGDCADYHGWVVGVGESDPRHVVAWRTRARGGAVWAPGGIASDGTFLYFATGNTMDTTQWADGEAVFRMPPDLRSFGGPGSFFAPADWHALDEDDLDLGGTNPLPFAVHSGLGMQRLLLALGKDGNAYLLDPLDLGGVGGALRTARVATAPIRTSPVVYPAGGAAMIAFQGHGADCPAGEHGDLTVLRIDGIKPLAVSTAWCGAMTGRGSPIVTTTDGRSDPIVWILGAEGDNRLHGFRGDNGAPLYTSLTPLAGLRHFQTLIAADNRLFVGADGRIYAFDVAR